VLADLFKHLAEALRTHQISTHASVLEKTFKVLKTLEIHKAFKTVKTDEICD